MVKFSNRTFVVSGGASGLGLAVVRRIAQLGGSIAVLDRDSATGEKVAKDVGSETCRFYSVDVSSTESIAAAVRAIVEWIKVSGRPLAGVVTAAGIGIGGMAINSEKQTLNMRDWDTVFGVNVRGSVDLATQLLPHWTTQQGGNDDEDRGAIIFVSSMVALEGRPEMMAYSSSKAAIMGAVLPLARDLATHRIRVVAVAPGAFDTPLFARLPDSVKEEELDAVAFPKRAGDPGKDFAPFIAHIFENAYLNGTTLRLDGGMRLPWKDSRI